MKRFKSEGNYFVVQDVESGVEEIRRTIDSIYYQEIDGNIFFYNKANEEKISQNEYNKDTVINGDNLDGGYSTLEEMKLYLNNATGSSSSESKPLMVVKASKLVIETTLASVTAKDDYVITVADATSFAEKHYLTIYNQVANRVFFATVLNITGSDITLDSPLDFEFGVGSFVSVGITNMNVDGSVTPQIFGIRNPTGVDIPLSYKVTRLVFNCLTNGANDLSKFGDIAGALITRGLVARKVDGTYRNIFNVKTNAELKNLMYDLDIQVVSNQQQDGFSGRFTLEKLGSNVTLKEDEDLQLLVQDNFSTLISLTIMAEGSEV